jgi:hypothetical protein
LFDEFRQVRLLSDLCKKGFLVRHGQAI